MGSFSLVDRWMELVDWGGSAWDQSPKEALKPTEHSPKSWFNARFYAAVQGPLAEVLLASMRDGDGRHSGYRVYLHGRLY